MDVIVIGVYSSNERDQVNSIVSRTEGLEIVWDYHHHNIEASRGIQELEKVYKLFDSGILVRKNRDVSFASYPLIYEVSEFVMGSDNYPMLFQFLDKLKELDTSKMIIAFADEWDENTLVRIEPCAIGSVKERLDSVFVWCESYVNLILNSEIRGDDHPLILEVEW